MEPIAVAQGRRVYLRKDSPTETLVFPSSPRLPPTLIDLVARAIHSRYSFNHAISHAYSLLCRLEPSRTSLRLQCFITGNPSPHQTSHITKNQSVILSNTTEACITIMAAFEYIFDCEYI